MWVLHYIHDFRKKSSTLQHDNALKLKKPIIIDQLQGDLRSLQVGFPVELDNADGFEVLITQVFG